MALHDDTGLEYQPMTMGEAGRLIREMQQKLDLKRKRDRRDKYNI